MNIRHNLIQGYMPRPLHHHLNARVPGTLHQLAQSEQLLDLRTVSSICKTSRTHAITQTQSHVILKSDLQQTIEMLIQRVLFPVMQHPGNGENAPSGDNSAAPASTR